MGRNNLRQLLASTRSLDILPRDVVREMLRSVERRNVQDNATSG